MPETALSNEITVNTSTTGDQVNAAVVALAGGGFVILWEDSQRGDIYGQRYDSSGNASGTEFLINQNTSGAQLMPSAVALTGGGFVVTWQSGTLSSADIYARIFDSNGSAITNDFLVNSTTSNEQLNPRVTGLSGGGFVVTWDTLASGNFEDVRGQIYNSSGATVGSQFVINTTTADQQGFSAIAPLSSGGFVAVWQSVTPSGSGNAELIAQRFDSSGTKVGSEFQVNSTTTGNQYGDDVAVMSDGSIVFSWTTPGVAGGQIYARRFDSSGSAITGEITISSTNQGALGRTSVSALANGAFVVSWVESISGVDRVLARAYDSSNTALTNVFVVSQTNSGTHFLTQDGAATLAAGSVVFAWEGTGSGQDIVMRRFGFSSIDGTSGADTLNGTSGNDIMNGLGGNDSLFLQQGGDDIVDGGDGNDGIYFGGAMTSADAVNGGSGTDTLALQGVYAGLTLGSGVVAVEVLLLLPGDNTQFGYLSGLPTSYVISTVDANVAATATLTVQATTLRSGENLTFNGSAETDGKFSIFAGKGIDTLTGGSGSDGFFFGAEINLTGADRVTGGGGVDSIALRGNYFGASAVVFQDASFTGIEVVTFLSGHTNEFGGVIDLNGFDYDVTLANGTIPSGVRLDVIATNLRSNESARVDASAELDGSIRILSGAGDDILIGSAGADNLFGALGIDTINGGGGADTYVYRATAESTSAARDTVTFASGDLFDLSFIDANSTTGTNDAFTFIGSSAFSGVAGQLRAFSSGAGQWTIEADVNGDSAADLVITVSTAATLGSGDFIL